MEITIKIQCPACGATSSYTETEPGHYKCGFCLSSWEQVSVLPEKNDEKEFFGRCEEIYNEQLKITREKPKYLEITFANISMFYSFFLEIENQELQEKLLPKFFTMVDNQVEEYANDGIDENIDRDKIFARHTDKFVLIIYLAELNYMRAKALALNYDEKEKLEEAIQKLKIAQHLHGPTIHEWQGKISKAIIGILQRLGEETKAFEYINSLFENQSVSAYKEYHTKSSGFSPDEEDIAHFIKDREEYTEEIKSLFEDIILSEAYKDWESKNVTKEEILPDEVIEEVTAEKKTADKTPTENTVVPETEKRSFWQKLFNKE